MPVSLEIKELRPDVAKLLLILLEGTKRSVYLRESPKMMEEPRIEIVR